MDGRCEKKYHCDGPLWGVVSIFVGPSQARRASRARASDGPTKILQKKFPKLSKIRHQNSYIKFDLECLFACKTHFIACKVCLVKTVKS